MGELFKGSRGIEAMTVVVDLVHSVKTKQRNKSFDQYTSVFGLECKCAVFKYFKHMFMLQNMSFKTNL